jgi:5-methyltetrahydrofolate--homocysteine methyltransferase
MSSRSDLFRAALAERVLVADGAMGTMLQAANPTMDDFEGHEGCNEVLNVTRPDVVRSVHEAYLAVGVDCIETNTFGANLGNLGEYGIADRIRELAESGARVAREFGGRLHRTERGLGAVGPDEDLAVAGH